MSGPTRMDRRTFLRSGVLASAAVAVCPERVLADPYAPLAAARRAASPIRVRGVVRSEGRGLAGVPVTDGFQVVDTDRDGLFELVTSADRDFVRISTTTRSSSSTSPVSPTRTNDTPSFCWATFRQRTATRWIDSTPNPYPT